MNDLLFEFLISHLPSYLVDTLKKTPQDPKFHGEIWVYNHIKMVYANLPNDIDLQVCAIFHDLGKIDTIRVFEKESGIRIQTIGHENYAEYYVNKYHLLFSDLEIDWEKVKFISREHMRCHKYLAGEIKKESKKVLFENHKYSKDLITFAIADGKGRIV